jgi:hypothetical protein
MDQFSAAQPLFAVEAFVKTVSTNILTTWQVVALGVVSFPVLQFSLFFVIP